LETEDQTVTTRKKFDYAFEPTDGEYKFIVNNTKDDMHINIRKISAVIKEEK
jgi:hypothetical protein